MNNSNSTEIQRIYLVPVEWTWRPVVQLVLAIIGILGNSLVIHVYRSKRELKGKPTNMFIAALAVADLVTSILIIPLPTLSRVPQNAGGSFYCKVVFTSNVMWISIVASIGTLTTLSVERYIAVGFPGRYKRIFTQKNTIVIIASVWFFGFAMSSFNYYQTFAIGGQCVYVIISTSYQVFLGVAIFLVEYLIPMIIMLATNIRTIQLLQRQATSLLGNVGENGPALTLLRARRRVVYMLLVVIMAFIISWSPDEIGFLLFNVGSLPVEYFYGDVYHAFVIWAFTNSCYNPVIYLITNRNFRQAFYDLLPSRKRSLASSTHKNSSALFDTPLEIDNEVNNTTGSVAISVLGDGGKAVSDMKDMDTANEISG